MSTIQTEPLPAPEQPRKPRRARKFLGIGGIALAVLIAIVVTVAVATGGNKPSSNHSNTTAQNPPAAASTAPAVPAPQEFTDPTGNQCLPADVVDGYCPGDSPAPSPAAPQYTVSQQQAISAAESYLSMGSGFSYQGLINQLSSSYGNGFSVADATFAVNHVQVDWNQQAVMAAKGYLSMGGFSCTSLVQQLSSPYGNYFTTAQARYAAAAVGLGSC